MGVRGKLLILFLCLAMVPLVGVGWLVHSTTTDMIAEVRKRNTESLTAQLTSRIQQIVEAGARLVGSEKFISEVALLNQVKEMERLLDGPAPDTPGRIYKPKDFEEGGVNPPDLALSKKHIKRSDDNPDAPISISLSHQVILLASGVDEVGVGADIARLLAMTETYEGMYQSRPDLFFWIYTALESGIHSSYPGHGGYPKGYDPRKRPWYKNARQAGKVIWNPPIVDATTRNPIMTVTAPLYGPDGSIAGVAAIDVNVLSKLESIASGPGMPAGASAMLVNVDNKKGPIRIIIRREPHTDDWQKEFGATDLVDGNAKILSQMAARMADSRSGMERMNFQGEDSLWAHGPIDDLGTHLLVIVPMKAVIEEVNSTENYIRGESSRQLRALGLIILVMVLLTIGVAVYSARRVTRPVHAFSKAATELAGGDFSVRVEVSSSDELGELAKAFNAMAPQLLDRIRVREALELAEEVQRNLLPRHAPNLPGFDIAGYSIYCDETGGDYYDFIDTSEMAGGRFGIVVGDVTGHGVAAALLMATVRASLRTSVRITTSLENSIKDINQHLAANVHRGRSMSLFFLVIDSQTHAIQWVSAGHDPALVYDVANDSFDQLVGEDIPLGIEADWQYREHSRDNFPPGCIIVVGTDGVWESRNESKNDFGKDALKEVIRKNAGKSAEDICQAVNQELTDFRGAAPQLDDITLVVIKDAR